ncbi:MAG: hypothetical protein EOO50_17205 [Flavobacterium sp.]|uniref:hypothetical protein n=1 Tax=Flavobacterium sp. TaxID=239 RepID=UPI001214EDD1|nr:hypothetical protein [Flavobacterium sp.]RZJ63289.1 MAG: hypothetical protein EOO50_17205 [Flavobacterium sp.]
MGNPLRFTGAFLLFWACSFAQVGIGTASVADCAILQLESTTAAFVMPRMTDAQMTAIPTPLPGSMVFNTSENLPYFQGASGWSGFDINSNPTIILSKSGGTFSTSSSTSYLMNLTAANALSTSSAYFTSPSAGTVSVSRNGVYLLSASLSTSNMPSGNRNFYLAAYLNGNLIGYLIKSRAQMTAVDYWGTTGTLMYPAQAGDVFTFKYFIDHNAALTSVFQTICITKLN